MNVVSNSHPHCFLLSGCNGQNLQDKALFLITQILHFNNGICNKTTKNGRLYGHNIHTYMITHVILLHYVISTKHVKNNVTYTK
jgi:uncharacterized membrane protein